MNMPQFKKERTLGKGFKIDKNMKSHADDPFFIEKGRRSEEMLKKYGFPEELLKIRAERMNKTKSSD
jgi:hypothetical protein